MNKKSLNLLTTIDIIISRGSITGHGGSEGGLFYTLYRDDGNYDTCVNLLGGVEGYHYVAGMGLSVHYTTEYGGYFQVLFTNDQLIENGLELDLLEIK